MEIRGKVAVVTGASAGVGRALVRSLAAAGADIVLLARGREGLDAARREVEAEGRRALVIPLDVADAGAVEAAAERAERELGPISIWVNNAMVSVFSPVIEMTAEEYRRVTEVTYLGYVHGTLSALRRMRPRDEGVIVNVGSALAYRGIPLQSAYCAAKHAVQGFTESLRVELIHDGSNVVVTEVHLPAINTTQFGWVKSRLPNRAQPVPPIIQPEVPAAAIRRAIEDPGRETWLGWPTVQTILGNRFVPGFVDHYLARNGFDSQQIEGEPDDPDRPHNLWDPVDDDVDCGAYGTFGDQAGTSAIRVTFPPGPVIGVLGGLFAGVSLGLAGRGLLGR